MRQAIHLVSILLVPSLLFLNACGTPAGEKNTALEATVKDPELAREAAGVYAGTVPCADCPGIDYRVNIKPDFTFEARMVYQERSEEPTDLSGSYAFTEDGILVLEKQDPGMNYFKVEPAALVMLDLEGREITGDLADRYRLTELTRGGRMAKGPQETAPNNEFMKRLAEQGIDFYARGNEPFWALDMDFDNVFRFTTMDGTEFNSPPGEGAMAMDAPVPITRYGAQTEAGSIVITMRREQCLDNMSGEVFSHKVTVEFQPGNASEPTTYEGCGRFVTDYDLVGAWTLTAMGEDPVDGSELPKGAPQLVFDPENLRISGHGSCNNINGSFQMGKSSIIFSQMASTMMACPDMEVETTFNRLISGRELKYELEGNQLVLTHPSGQTLVFEKA